MTPFNSTKTNAVSIIENKKSDRSIHQRVLKFLVLGLLIVFLGNAAIAESNLITISETMKTTFILHLPEASKTSSQVILRDMKGEILHREILAAGIETQHYNLRNLPSGEYVVSITNNTITKWQHISLRDGVLQTDGAPLQIVSLPTIRFRDGYLDLNMLCISDSEISVILWDEHGNELVKERLAAEGSVQRRYNLKGLKEGQYHLSVSLDHAIIDVEFDQSIQWSPETTLQYNSNQTPTLKKGLGQQLSQK